MSMERFILDQDSAFQDCATTVMHQHCFQAWEHRKLYVRLFNEYQRTIETPDYRIRMKASGAIASRLYEHKNNHHRK